MAEYLAHQRSMIESALNRHIPKSSVPGADKLNDALNYALFPGGQRWRPLFTLMGASLAGREDFTADSDAMAVACSVEFLHTSSLIFDDLPSMDDAGLRRGKAALHLVFGQGTSILAALALLNQSYTLLASVGSSEVAKRLVSEASFCIGSNGMIGGQAVDLRSGESPCGATQTGGRNLKTTALTRLMMIGGAMTANARENEILALARFGECLGLAYQIYDDLLDASDAGTASGKTARQDARLARPSVLSDLRTDEAVKLAFSAIEEGIEGLQKNFKNSQTLTVIVSVVEHLFLNLRKCGDAVLSCDKTLGASIGSSETVLVKDAG